MYSRQGGAFISIMGTTKLGKSTFVKEVMATAKFHVYIPGQNLVEGASALWPRLVAELGIPTSTTTGKVTGDKSKWSIFGRLGISTPVVKLGAGTTIGGERHTDNSQGSTFEMDAPKAVAEGFKAIAADARSKKESPPIIVIDDFHFILDPLKRRELILALRQITEEDATFILATLPGREDDEGFQNTNVGGRHYAVTVPVWDDEELREIATEGFKTLHVGASQETVDRLIRQSFGSPQLMQQHCLNLCVRVNKVEDSESGVGWLEEPDSWDKFFRWVKDPQSAGWLKRLGLGLTARRPRVANVTVPDGSVLDGYQAILWSLHALGAPKEISFAALRDQISSIPNVTTAEVNRLGMEGKARNMNVVAARDMTDALKSAPSRSTAANDDEDDGVTADTESDDNLFTNEEIRVANQIPQPVFEVVGEKAADMQIRILDPLLAYTLHWHPESFKQ